MRAVGGPCNVLELFASVGPWQSTIRAGAEALVPALIADDQAWTAARAGRLAGRLAHHPPAAGLAITHARLFDDGDGAIDGDPTQDITTVRNTDVVVCRGVMYDPGELFAAVGMRAR